MRKLTEPEARRLGELAYLPQPQVLVETELLAAVLETLALYGERLEYALDALADLLLREAIR